MINANLDDCLHSGIDNLLNENSLDYAIDMAASNEYFKSIYEKASVYMYYIITRHVFFDGNKRTAIRSAMYFLEKNGAYQIIKPTDNKITEYGEKTAENKYDIEKISNWFRRIYRIKKS